MGITTNARGGAATPPYISHLLIAALSVGGFLALGVAAPSTAAADQVKYVGGHPASGTSYCYIEAPHVHAYKPHKVKTLYRTYNKHHYFIGDPVPYKYKGPKHAYRGHHPVPVNVVLGDAAVNVGGHHEFCYLTGPHYHSYRAPRSPGFVLKGGATWYVGPFPNRYRVERPRLARINVVYKPLRYRRPVVTVAPPFGYVEPVVEVHVPAVRAAHVRAGAVRGHVRAGVEVRAPSVHLDVQLPGVIVVGGGHKHHRHKRKHYYKTKHHKYKRSHYKYNGKRKGRYFSGKKRHRRH